MFEQVVQPTTTADWHPYVSLASFAVEDHKGLLYVTMTDDGVTQDKYIIADAVLIRPETVGDPQDAASRPGSFANRDENAFFGGLQLQMDSVETQWKKVYLNIHDTLSPQLNGKTLKLNFEGDGFVINVWTTADGQPGTQINDGHTWVIGQDVIPDAVYVEGALFGQGSAVTELIVSLDDPLLEGMRPLSDGLIIRVVADQ